MPPIPRRKGWVMHDCIRSLVFRRFEWFLIIAFSFFSTPHVEFIFPWISNLFVSDAYADTTNIPILGLVQKGKDGYYLAIGYDNDGNLLFNDRVELHTYWIKRKIMIPYNNRCCPAKRADNDQLRRVCPVGHTPCYVLRSSIGMV
jgi:hypothetical protein